jgi:hypothetical protein
VVPTIVILGVFIVALVLFGSLKTTTAFFLAAP